VRDFQCETEIGLYYLRNRRLVCWLYALRRSDGYEFAPGAIFEVLRQDGDRLNLCEVDPTHPFRIGATVTRVKSAAITPSLSPHHETS